MFEVSRKFSIVEITEIGLFHEGKVPPDYLGAKLKIEVVHQVRFVDETGKGFTLSLAAPPAQLTNGTETTVYDIVYDRNAEINESYESGGGYKHMLPQTVKTRADYVKDWVEQDSGSSI